jgi:hypothetical protein
MKLKWAFCFVASAVWLVSATVLPQLWLATDHGIPHAFDFLYVLQNAFTTALTFAAIPLAGLFIYSFSVLAKERQQTFLVSWLPVVIGLGMVLAIAVPVRSDARCGNQHSVVPLAFSPIFLIDQHLKLQFLTYDLDDPIWEDCD